MEASATLSPTVLRTVENALSARYHVHARVGDVKSFPSSRVSRCWVEALSAAPPPTVIVRVLREDSARSGMSRIHNERAALEFLTSIGSVLAPGFIAADGASGILITEDLGHHPSLLDLLLGADSSDARRGLLAFARGLGKLHAQSVGHASAYEERRVQLGPADPKTEYHNIYPSLHETWAHVRHAVNQLGLPQPRGIDNDVETISHILTVPSNDLALSSGDPSLVNCMVANDEVRFFDFEDASFRHPLIDACVVRYLYPTGGPVWGLPSDVAGAIEATYRAELGRACPFALNDVDYERGMAAASASWTILRLARLVKVDAGPDRDSWPILPPGWSAPIPTRSRRQQLVSILETCIASLKRAGTLDALADWCESMVDSLRARWTEAMGEIPLYPAFQ